MRHGNVGRRLVTAGVLICFMTVSTACYGPFNLTRNVYHWNSGVKGSGEVSDKWMKELIFFGMIVIPVYMFSALLDAFIFNSIQFWSGDNPVKVTQDDEGRIREVQLGKITATVAWAEGGRSAQVTYVKQGQIVKQMMIEYDKDQLRLRDQAGQVLVTAGTREDGSLQFMGRDGRVADVVRSEQVLWGAEQLSNAAL
jgi:hypothetical protein